MRDLAVVVGLIHEENLKDQDDAPEDRDDPVRPLPLGFPGNERRDEGAKVRRQDNEAGPDVDFSSG